MTEQERPEITSRPGAIALSLAGIAELVVSAVLYGLKLYAPAIAFGVGALFVALIANTIAGQSRAMQLRQGITPPPETDRAQANRLIGFYSAAFVGTAAVILAIVQMVSGEVLPAITFVVWSLTCAVFALRFR